MESFINKFNNISTFVFTTYFMSGGLNQRTIATLKGAWYRNG